jgi:hypothetical protein
MSGCGQKEFNLCVTEDDIKKEILKLVYEIMKKWHNIAILDDKSEVRVFEFKDNFNSLKKKIEIFESKDCCDETMLKQFELAEENLKYCCEYFNENIRKMRFNPFLITMAKLFDSLDLSGLVWTHFKVDDEGKKLIENVTIGNICTFEINKSVDNVDDPCLKRQKMDKE